MILHLLATSHATLTAADLLALGRLICDYDIDKSGTLDLGEFKVLSRELVEIYIFNGREALETLEVRGLSHAQSMLESRILTALSQCG